jgi:hypothetical protein
MTDIVFSSWGGEIFENRNNKSDNQAALSSHVELPEYFKQDEKIKALMGWKGIVLRSPEVDIIDLCREYFEAVLAHSKTCDKCNYCKTGWEEMLEVFEDIAAGEATDEDLEFMQSAAEAIVSNAKCSIGKFGPTPLFHALKYFADDFAQAISGEKPVTRGTYHSKLTAPCLDACPIHLDIPKYVELIKDAKFAESLAVIAPAGHGWTGLFQTLRKTLPPRQSRCAHFDKSAQTLCVRSGTVRAKRAGIRNRPFGNKRQRGCCGCRSCRHHLCISPGPQGAQGNDL